MFVVSVRLIDRTLFTAADPCIHPPSFKSVQSGEHDGTLPSLIATQVTSFSCLYRIDPPNEHKKTARA